MTDGILTASVVNPRRVAVRFTATIGFLFADHATGVHMESLDGIGPSPGDALYVLNVAGDALSIHAIFGEDMAAGGRYRFTIDSINVAGSPVAVTADLFYAPASHQIENLPPEEDVTGILYGEDLVHDGNDFVESADGDLETVTGVENAKAALVRACLSNGLPYSEGYGARPRRFIDGAAQNSSTLRGALLRTMLDDDRVEECSAVPIRDENAPSEVTFNLTAKFVGESDAITVPVRFQP